MQCEWHNSATMFGGGDRQAVVLGFGIARDFHQGYPEQRVSPGFTSEC